MRQPARPQDHKTTRLVLALGTNLGDRTAILAAARELIEERIGPIIAASSEIQTAAWGVTDQPDFLNQVIVVDYFLTPPPLRPQLHRLLNTTQGIEADLGRERKVHWGPRTCDIDIIFFGDLQYEDERLSIPHPWWQERDFVGGIIRRELTGIAGGPMLSTEA